MAQTIGRKKSILVHTAVILVSDGLANQGGDPVAAARSVRDEFPGPCFHVISLADKPKGELTLHAISRLGPCAYAEGKVLLADRQNMAAFVQDIFYLEIADAAPAADEIEPPVMAAPAPEAAPVPVIFPMAHFAFDKADLSSAAMGVLDQIAVELNRTPGMKAIIEGHTDNTGPESYNQKLSERRARAAFDYLSAKGIAPDQMKTVGYGESMPKVSNLSPEGRAINRRVEVVTVPNEPKSAASQ